MCQPAQSKSTSKINITGIEIKTNDTTNDDAISENSNNNDNYQRTSELQISINHCNLEPRKKYEY